MNFISRFFIKRQLNKEQKAIHEEYEKNGLTDEILERQIALNTKRNELDIPDPTEQTSDKYVQ